MIFFINRFTDKWISSENSSPLSAESIPLQNLNIYLGKSKERQSELEKRFGKGGATVITFLKEHLNKSHKVVVDN